MGVPGKSGLRVALERLADAPLPAWPRAEAATRRLRLETNAPLFQAGRAYPYVCCVAEGAMKLVYDTEDGKSWIKAFCTPGVVFASITALRPGGLTSFAARAALPTLVDRLDFAVVEALSSEHRAWQQLLVNAFRVYGERKEKRERELLTLSVEARYLQFLQDHSELSAQLSQREIAAYVRVTPVALSRIRARLRRSRSRVQT